MPSENLYVIENALPPHLFTAAREEFLPCYNFRNEEKVESRIIREDFLPFFPSMAAIYKPEMSKGLGDVLTFIKIGERLKLQAQKLLRTPLELIRINSNIQKFGDESTFHKDGGFNSWSFLVFVVSAWAPEWGGEFNIEIEPRTLYNVPVVPNRGVLFRANLMHRGAAPNRFCNAIRYSLAFTYNEINKK